MCNDMENNVGFQKLVSKLKRKLEARNISMNDSEIEDEIQFALLEYYNDRHFSPTNEQLYEPIYEGIIIQLAISSIAKEGAEGETSHSEGGVGRGYDNGSNYPLSLTKKIIPLVKGVDI